MQDGVFEYEEHSSRNHFTAKLLCMIRLRNRLTAFLRLPFFYTLLLLQRRSSVGEGLYIFEIGELRLTDAFGDGIRLISSSGLASARAWHLDKRRF